MKNYFFIKYSIRFLRRYIFILLTATLFLNIFSTKSISEENVFIIKDVKVKGLIDLNFTRDKYLDRAFFDSFEILMSKILLSSDIRKVKGISLEKIKYLIESFQIIEESYRKDEYIGLIKVSYDQLRVKNFLREKNISFSQPENIDAIFFPVFFVEDEFQNFSENYFYKKWLEIKIKNELINFILPLDDIDDITKIIEMKAEVENINIEDLSTKYDIQNYVFALMDYRNKKLNVHLKTNFNKNKISKNIFYDINNIEDELVLNEILKDLKLIITDLWKEENLVNLLMPLTIEVVFNQKNLENLNKIRNTLSKINIIDSYYLEKFNVNNSYFKIYYYGDPKKLSSELSKLWYNLKNNQGSWQLYLNE